MPLKGKHINPPELYRHPSFTRVVTVSGPMRLVFIAGKISLVPLSGDDRPALESYP